MANQDKTTTSIQDLIPPKHSLKAFLTECNLSQNQDSGFSEFMNYYNHSKKIPHEHNSLRDLNFFHILMENYARAGNLQKISEIFTILLQDDITPDCQTFSLIFECFGRIPMSEENTHQLRTFVESAERNVSYYLKKNTALESE